MKTKKTAKRKFTKRTAAAIMIAMLVIAGCIGSASAAVESWTHTVSCAATGSTSFVFNAEKTGNRTDTFNSYITIYNGKSYSKGETKVVQNGKTYKKQPYYLQGNSPSHPTIYFDRVPYGSSVHYYDKTIIYRETHLPIPLIILEKFPQEQAYIITTIPTGDSARLS